MKTTRLWPAIAACTLLAACGGGSTSGGGGVGSTPTPSPGPTPGPTPTNTSLSDLRYSETFTSNAAQAGAKFTEQGATASTASASSLTVRYDASARSYTVANGDRTQTFVPTDRVSSTIATNTYRRTNGPTTETLTLTKPGASGVLTYEYVGAGYWERATEQGNAVLGSFDAFTYGVETPDGALPRTGQVDFGVDLIGLLAAYELEPLAMSGSGSLIADFATGRIDTQGRFDVTRPSTGPTGYSGVWEGVGQLSSTANLFSGDFRLYLFGQLDGGMDGRFYGPEAQEVGAAFWARSASGQISSGTLTGRRDPFPVSPLEDLDRDMTYPSTSSLFVFETDAQGDVVQRDGFARYNAGAGSTASIEYDADTDRYAMRTQALAVDGRGEVQYQTINFAPDDRASDQSDGRFTTYRVSLGDDRFADVKVYKANATNPELVLSYASFAQIASISPGVEANVSLNRIDYVPFGAVTPADQIPVAGTGRYTGVIHGNGQVGGSGMTMPAAPSPTRYSLSGSSQFEFNFLEHNGTLTLNPVGTDVKTGETRDFGSYVLSMSGNTELRGTLFDPMMDGKFSGYFYGPRANEFGGAFYIRMPNRIANQITELTGVTVGKRN